MKLLILRMATPDKDFVRSLDFHQFALVPGALSFVDFFFPKCNGNET